MDKLNTIEDFDNLQKGEQVYLFQNGTATAYEYLGPLPTNKEFHALYNLHNGKADVHWVHNMLGCFYKNVNSINDILEYKKQWLTEQLELVNKEIEKNNNKNNDSRQSPR